MVKIEIKIRLISNSWRTSSVFFGVAILTDGTNNLRLVNLLTLVCWMFIVDISSYIVVVDNLVFSMFNAKRMPIIIKIRSMKHLLFIVRMRYSWRCVFVTLY